MPEHPDLPRVADLGQLFTQKNLKTRPMPSKEKLKSKRKRAGILSNSSSITKIPIAQLTRASRTRFGKVGGSTPPPRHHHLPIHQHRQQPISEGGKAYHSSPTSSNISRKLFNPASIFSIISAAKTSGSGKFSKSIRLLSFSQKMSKLVLSRSMISL